MAKKKSQLEQILDLIPRISVITKEQRTKIVKAAAYSFVSSFVFFILIQLQSGVTLDMTLILSAGISATNAAIVAVKQAFTQGE